MGIQGLLPMLKPAHTWTDISDYAGQTLAVDAYVWLHKGAYGCAVDLVKGKQTTKFVDYCMHRVRLLKYHGVKPYVVFDGGHLPAKSGTEDERAQRREENLAKAKALEDQGRISDARDLYAKCLDITPEMAFQFIKALRAESVSYVVAPYEADAQLAFLERRGLVDGIITEDSDLLVFGCRNVLFKMDSDGKCCEIRRETIGFGTGAGGRGGEFRFDGWGDREFRHMAILSGCDYLPSINRIGIKTAHKLLRKHKSVEKVLQHLKLEGYDVPSDYKQLFRMAELTFLHQRVYDPETETVVPLSPLPDGFGEEEGMYIGPALSLEMGQTIALGNRNPITKALIIDPWPSHQPAKIKTPLKHQLKSSAAQPKINSFFQKLPPSSSKLSTASPSSLRRNNSAPNASTLAGRRASGMGIQQFAAFGNGGTGSGSGRTRLSELTAGDGEGEGSEGAPKRRSTLGMSEVARGKLPASIFDELKQEPPLKKSKFFSFTTVTSSTVNPNPRPRASSDVLPQHNDPSFMTDISFEDNRPLSPTQIHDGPILLPSSPEHLDEDDEEGMDDRSGPPKLEQADDDLEMMDLDHIDDEDPEPLFEVSSSSSSTSPPSSFPSNASNTAVKPAQPQILVPASSLLSNSAVSQPPASQPNFHLTPNPFPDVASSNALSDSGSHVSSTAHAPATTSRACTPPPPIPDVDHIVSSPARGGSLRTEIMRSAGGGGGGGKRRKLFLDEDGDDEDGYVSSSPPRAARVSAGVSIGGPRGRKRELVDEDEHEENIPPVEGDGEEEGGGIDLRRVCTMDTIKPDRRSSRSESVISSSSSFRPSAAEEEAEDDEGEVGEVEKTREANMSSIGKSWREKFGYQKGGSGGKGGLKGALAFSSPSTPSVRAPLSASTDARTSVTNETPSLPSRLLPSAAAANVESFYASLLDTERPFPSSSSIINNASKRGRLSEGSSTTSNASTPRSILPPRFNFNPTTHSNTSKPSFPSSSRLSSTNTGTTRTTISTSTSVAADRRRSTSIVLPAVKENVRGDRPRTSLPASAVPRRNGKAESLIELDLDDVDRDGDEGEVSIVETKVAVATSSARKKLEGFRFRPKI